MEVEIIFIFLICLENISTHLYPSVFWLLKITKMLLGISKAHVLLGFIHLRSTEKKTIFCKNTSTYVLTIIKYNSICDVCCDDNYSKNTKRIPWATLT